MSNEPTEKQIEIQKLEIFKRIADALERISRSLEALERK